VYVDDFGHILRSCSVEEIKTAVKMISSFRAEQLKRRARMASEYARTTHARARFAEAYRKVIATILAKRGIRAQSRARA
jgi:hypothetical protein